MEDEKKELNMSIRLIQDDYENLGVAIDSLECEIYGENTSQEKLKKLIEDVELFTGGIYRAISKIDEARVIFRKKQIINELEKSER